MQKKALQTKEKYYGKKIYLRALIEFTNYCKRECRYCGINRYNTQVERYRLSEEEILKACQRAKELGQSALEKAKEFKEEAAERAEELKDEAVDKAKELKDKAEDKAIDAKKEVEKKANDVKKDVEKEVEKAKK